MPIITISESLLDYGPNDKIVAQTKVTIPADKRQPVHAESVIESVPQKYLPTPSTSSSESSAPPPPPKDNMKYYTPQKEDDRYKTPHKTPQPSHLYHTSKKMFTPSAPSLDDLDAINDDPSQLYATVKKKPSSSNVMSIRPHNFTSKTFLKPESCGYCAKKIRFGSAAWKCNDCRTCVHQDCRDKLTVSCLPQSTTTPIAKSGAMGTISEYTPSMAPQVPALIVHCVNEIETRGLTEVGLYRVSGGDRDVKALKERFLRNKGIPNLAEIDIHVLCGCVKDFLRSLREPLIPLNLWSVFSNAAQTIPSDEDNDVSRDMYRAVEMLPQPNRDTLAYLIMHFQRIAECPEVKMPLSNFAKIFGPTLIGYSCAEPDQHKMFAETEVQYSVMFCLLNIPTKYWNKFITLGTLTPEEERRCIDTYGSKFYSGEFLTS